MTEKEQKKKLKRLKKISALYEKAISAETVLESLDVVRTSQEARIDEKLEVAFLLGRIYERQGFQAEMDELLQSKLNENK